MLTDFLEACAVIGRGGSVLYWHVPEDREFAYLPDSASLWRFLWERRDEISGIAHTHPAGYTHPSSEDLSTFKAVDLALGKSLDWYVVTSESVRVCRRNTGYSDMATIHRPIWVDPLLRLSKDVRDG